MNSPDFKNRYVTAISSLPLPPTVRSRVTEFVPFHERDVAELNEVDAHTLVTQGLPRAAAPFLSFRVYTGGEIASLRRERSLPNDCFPIGQTGAGDLLVVDLPSGNVVYLNHDSSNRPVFINSALPKFYESLCIYREHLTAKAVNTSLVAIRSIDPPACASGAMWHSELAEDSAG